MLHALALLVQSSIPIPPVELNHFFVTVDRPTWEAIRSNTWLKEQFASVSVRTNSDGVEKWTGIYVNGIGSYIEIFAPHANFKEGDCGIGLLTPTPGGADSIDHHFRKGHFGNRTVRELMNLDWDGKLEPFSHIVTFNGQQKTRLNVWLMEYHEEFFRRVGLPAGTRQAAITESFRRRGNRPYRGMMGDLRSLTVHPKTGDLRQALPLLGFRASARSNRFSRGQSEIVIAPASRYAISSARMSLRRNPVRNRVETFGKRCRLLIFSEGYAEWRFN